MAVHPSVAAIDWSTGSLQAPNLRTSEKKLGQLRAVFHDQQSWQKMDPETVVYRVWWWEPVAAGTEGGLFWGGTEIQPGRVGNEYFMTHGHRHAIANRAEFYGTTVGEGILVLGDESGRVWAEEMKPGSMHYIPGRVAHRVVTLATYPSVLPLVGPVRLAMTTKLRVGRGWARESTSGTGEQSSRSPGINCTVQRHEI